MKRVHKESTLRGFQVQLTTQDNLSADRHQWNRVPLYKSQVLSLHTERRCHMPLSKLTRPDHYTTKNENCNFHDPLPHMSLSPLHKLSLHVMLNVTAHRR